MRSSQTQPPRRWDRGLLACSCKEVPAVGHVPAQVWGKSSVGGHRLRQEPQRRASPKVCPALALLSGRKKVPLPCPPPQPRCRRQRRDPALLVFKKRTLGRVGEDLCLPSWLTSRAATALPALPGSGASWRAVSKGHAALVGRAGGRHGQTSGDWCGWRQQLQGSHLEAKSVTFSCIAVGSSVSESSAGR